MTDLDRSLIFEPPSRMSPVRMPVGGQTAHREVNNSQHRLNDAVSLALLAIVALAPIPLASNRPAFWMTWAVVVGLLGLSYSAGIMLTRGAPRVSLSAIWLETVLFLALLGFLLYQLLPISWLLPQPYQLPDGTVLESVTPSLDPDSTRLELIVFLTFGLFFILVNQVAANRRRARRMLMAIFLIVAAFAIFGLLSLTQLGDTILGFEKKYYLGNATGTFIHRGSFALFLGMGLAIGMPLLIGVFAEKTITLASRWTLTLLVICGQAFILATLFATSSRWGVLSGLTGGAVGFFLSVAVMPLRRRSKVMLLVLGLASVAGLFALYGNDLVVRVVLSSEDQGRNALYPQVWAAINLRPLWGYGGGSFASVFPMLQQPSLNGDLVWDRAHSAYLALWFEHGYIAGSIPLVIVGIVVTRALLALREASSTLLSIATVAAAVVFALECSIDISAEIEANALLFIALLALGAGGGASSKASGGR